MKIQLVFKTPYVDGRCIEEVFQHAESNEDGQQAVQGYTREDLENAIAKFVEYGEYATIEIDMANLTARVVPVKE